MIKRKSHRKKVKETALKRSAPKKDQKTEIDELRWYLSIIGDFRGKLFNNSKYPEISGDDSEVLASFLIDVENGPDGEYEEELWKICNGDSEKYVSEKQLDWMKKAIIESYRDWVDWIKDSEYKYDYPELLESLHPATLNSLPKIIPGYQSPDQIRVFQDLEKAYDPYVDSEFEIEDFKEFMENDPKNYQKLAKRQRDRHLRIADLIRKHIIENTEIWPRKWMLANRKIMKNLESKKYFIPILNFITEHAYHRTDSKTKEHGFYKKDDKEFLYIMTKINPKRIATSLGVSPDLVYRYIRVMKKAGFIKKLTNPYYAIGYWNNRIRVFFIKDTADNRKILAEFSLR